MRSFKKNYLKYSSSLEVSYSFHVYLPNSQVFAVNSIFKIPSWPSVESPLPVEQCNLVAEARRNRLLRPYVSFGSGLLNHLNLDSSFWYCVCCLQN